MIKICSIGFEEIPCENHWLTFARFGPDTGYVCRQYADYRDVDLQLFGLSPEDTWQISFDQSTTNSGVFIKNYQNTRVIMLEMHRDWGDTADDFIFDFEMLLHKICQGVQFTHLLYERPITSESYRSSEVLFQLEGMLRQLIKRYDEFKTARLDYIENSSWRKVVVDSKKYSNYNRKSQTYKSISEFYPWTCFYGASLGDDYDIYEAMGVMFGWFINSYDALGRPYVRGDKFNGRIGGFILPDVSSREVAHSLQELKLDADWFVENPRKSIYENIASGLEPHHIRCVEISSPSAMLALFVECNLKWTSPEKATLVIVPANFVDSRLFDITGKEYHFVF